MSVLLIKGAYETRNSLRLTGFWTLLQIDALVWAHSQLCFCVLKVAGKWLFEFCLPARVRLVLKNVLSQHGFAGFDRLGLIPSMMMLVWFFDSLLAWRTAPGAQHFLSQAFVLLHVVNLSIRQCFLWKRHHFWDRRDPLGPDHRLFHNLRVTQTSRVHGILFTLMVRSILG